MNRLIAFICLISIGFSSPSVLQGQVGELIFNPNGGQHQLNLTGLKGLKEGDQYEIHVTGVNLNLYKIEIETADTTISSPIPFPSFASLGLGEVSKLIEGITSGSVATLVASQPTSSDATEIKINLSQAVDLTGEPAPQAWDEVRKQLDDLIIQKDNSTDSLRKSSDKLNSWYLNAYTFSLESLKSQPSSTISLNYQNRLQEIGKIRANIRALQIDVSILSKELRLVNSQISKLKPLIKDTPELKTVIATLEKNAKTLEKDLTLLEAAIKAAIEMCSAQKISDLLQKLIFLDNNRTTSYWTLPIQVQAERTKVTLRITPRNKDIPVPAYVTSFSFPKKSQNYQAVGLSLYVGGLYDDAYSFAAIPDTDDPADTLDYVLTSEQPVQLETGMAALLRFGKKFGSNETIGAHGTLGVGTSIGQSVRPRFLVGGGFAFGRKHMFALDVGGILGYVERRSQTIAENAVLEDVPETVTVSALRGSVFLSLGYIFSL